MAKPNRSYEDLQVWRKSIALCKQVYVISKLFPKEELFGLTSQMRRAAVSIASNIAEGCARNSTKEFNQFIAVALGSAAELKTQIIICQEIGLLKAEIGDSLRLQTVEIEKMLAGLQNSLISAKNLQLTTCNS